MKGAIDQKPWVAEGEEKRRVVRDMFADIAPSYDLVNSVVSFRQHYRWRKAAVRAIELRAGERVLDLCCGTGDFLKPILAVVGDESKVVGVDFCEPMLVKAREKFGPGVGLGVADACDLPVASESFDAVTVGWGLRNVPDLDAALREAARVLVKGGRFVSLDMARPRGLFGGMSEWVAHTVVPKVGRLFGKSVAYEYLPKSTLKFASREELRERMEAVGFGEIKMKDFMFGNICMIWGVKR